jgi:hypothetical protein
MALDLILGYLISGFAGVVIGVLIDEPLRSAKKSLFIKEVLK